MILIKKIRGAGPGARLDWLHEENSIFPDFCGQFEDDDGSEFIAAVWRCEGSWSAAVEGPDAYHTMLMSYRWWPIGEPIKKIYCYPIKGMRIVLDSEVGHFMNIAKGSIHLFKRY